MTVRRSPVTFIARKLPVPCSHAGHFPGHVLALAGASSLPGFGSSDSSAVHSCPQCLQKYVTRRAVLSVCTIRGVPTATPHAGHEGADCRPNLVRTTNASPFIQLVLSFYDDTDISANSLRLSRIRMVFLCNVCKVAGASISSHVSRACDSSAI